MDDFILPHFHHCKPRLQHALIWSNDADLFNQSIEFIKQEFDNSIFPVTIDDIPTIIEHISPDEIELEIEKYDFHVIKVHTDCIELILKDNRRHIIRDIPEFEDRLEQAGRIILNWYWENQY